MTIYKSCSCLHKKPIGSSADGTAFQVCALSLGGCGLEISSPTTLKKETQYKMVDCPECEGSSFYLACYGGHPVERDCEHCYGTGQVEEDEAA